MLGIELLGRAVVAGFGHLLVPPVVAAFFPGNFAARALVHQHMLHGGTAVHRFIDSGFQLHFTAAPVGAVLRDDGDGFLVGDAIDQRVGRESAEDDRVHRSDARAGQHGNRQLGTHAHVDGDTITRLDAQRLQHVGALVHFLKQLLIGERADFARLALPDDGGLVLAKGRDVTVEAVVGKVDLARRETTSPTANSIPVPCPTA